MTMNENRKKQIVLIAALVAVSALVIYALIFYGMGGGKKAAVQSAEPSETPEVTIIKLPEADHKKSVVTAEEVESVLKEASELTTSKYYYSNCLRYENTKDWFGTGIDNPFTKSKGYILYDGTVSVGIDISQITFDIDNDREIVTIHLPEEKILSHEIDNDTLKTDSNESIFNMLNAEDYSKMIGGCKKETETKILKNKDYMKQVRNNTEQVIRNFFLASKLTEGYVLEFD